MSHPKAGAKDESAKQAEAIADYTNKVSELFADELFAVHSSDASAETLKDLRSCIEASYAVWGDPLRLPEEHQY